MARASVKVDVIGTAQYRRLVELLHEVEALARINADEEFLAVVERCRIDLERLAVEGS